MIFIISGLLIEVLFRIWGLLTVGSRTDFSRELDPDPGQHPPDPQPCTQPGNGTPIFQRIILSMKRVENDRHFEIIIRKRSNRPFYVVFILFCSILLQDRVCTNRANYNGKIYLQGDVIML